MKVVLITGCSSGIGLATAAHLAHRGFRVFASARQPERSPGLEQLRSEGLPLAGVLTLDVTDPDSVRAAVERSLEQEGRLDALVNNAGIGGSGPVEELDLDDARLVMETNYLGAVRMIQAVLPEMRRRGSGAIVNVSSMAGRVALAAFGPYAASKAALESLSECLAQEVAGFGIRVAVVEPGVIATPIFAKGSRVMEEGSAYPAARRRLRALFRTQLRCQRPPELVAEVIEHAILTDSPKLRYLVGGEAEALVGGRSRVSDEEWVALGGIENEDAFFDAAARLFGEDLFRTDQG
jgi:NAD(P)-dependent dehydrogenase (short-subunit alcohol dehydrogenase family)